MFDERVLIFKILQCCGKHAVVLCAFLGGIFVSEVDASWVVINGWRVFERRLFADTSMVVREKVQSSGEECM